MILAFEFIEHKSSQLSARRVEGTFWHWLISKERMGFILTFAKHSEHCGCCKTYSKQPPPPRHFSCQLWVILTWTSKQQDPPPPNPSALPPHFLWQQCPLMICPVDQPALLKQSRSTAASVCGCGETPLLCDKARGARAPSVLSSESNGASSGTVVGAHCL